MSRNHLGGGDCSALVEAIKHNSTITQLNLSWNSLPGCYFISLAEAVKNNVTIRQLDFSMNVPDDDSTVLVEAINFAMVIVTVLADAFKHN